MIRYSILAAVAATTLLAAGAAAAQDNNHMVVRLGDLNTSTPQGAQVAHQRIKAAAAQFCGGDETRDISRIAEERACRERMINKAEHRLDGSRTS